LQLGNVYLTVQPLLGIEGDPMRLLFERDLTPHPQYCAAYEYMRASESDGGVGAQAVIHLGMHGTEEWLPGQPLGNDEDSWSDELIGDLPNIYVYAANNPSESILAKRRGYGTIVSHNVPPYGRSGLYLELANLGDLVEEYREDRCKATAAAAAAAAADIKGSNGDGVGGLDDLREAIRESVRKSGIARDVPPPPSHRVDADDDDADDGDDDGDLPTDAADFDGWIEDVSAYLREVETRLFSSGLHVLGKPPGDEELASYLDARFGEGAFGDDDDDPSRTAASRIVSGWRRKRRSSSSSSSSSPRGERRNRSLSFFDSDEEARRFVRGLFRPKDNNRNDEDDSEMDEEASARTEEAHEILDLLSATTEEMDSVIRGLDGGYIPAAPGGDLIRDGPSVLPTGRNIHSLDPYRMPSAGAWARGRRIAEELIRQHREDDDEGGYPETIAVTMWGLDAIKTRGESVAIALALVGAKPVREGTGRIVRFDLVPLSELGRPRIDVLASLSGIFRDSFANVVDLLDDMFERAAAADGEPLDMNFVKKHAAELSSEGVERPAARLFSNPPGDYGSMVNEVVGTGDWDDPGSLGEIWRDRNVFSYGRNEGIASSDAQPGTARPEVLDKLLEGTDRIVQEVDSIEYGLTDIQEYYANTGALKRAAENRRSAKFGAARKRVTVSVVEAFGGPGEGGGGDDDDDEIPAVRELEEILRLEYRTKLLNPRWADSMLKKGSGGAYEVSQRFTAMIGWAATASDGVDDFVFDQAAERYALDEEAAEKLRRSNPEAFKNVIGRLLEAAGRGMWSTCDDGTLEKLRELYADADDLIERGSAVV